MTSGSGARRRGGGGIAVLLLAAVLLMGVACGDDSASPEGAAETIDRDTFVATYVDLRLAALGNPDGTITPTERERVLENHGVGREDLLRFVDVHAQRLEFMRGVWDEVEERIQRAGSPRDTTSS